MPDPKPKIDVNLLIATRCVEAMEQFLGELPKGTTLDEVRDDLKRESSRCLIIKLFELRIPKPRKS